MRAARQGHAATALLKGEVYVAGGDEKGTAEVYDAFSDEWRPAGTLTPNRMNATASRLHGPGCRASKSPRSCGTALVVGGVRHRDQLGWQTTASSPQSSGVVRMDALVAGGVGIAHGFVGLSTRARRRGKRRARGRSS